MHTTHTTHTRTHTTHTTHTSIRLFTFLCCHCSPHTKHPLDQDPCVVQKKEGAREGEELVWCCSFTWSVHGPQVGGELLQATLSQQQMELWVREGEGNEGREGEGRERACATSLRENSWMEGRSKGQEVGHAPSALRTLLICMLWPAEVWCALTSALQGSSSAVTALHLRRRAIW